MAAVTICSDFGAQESKVCQCFHCFPSICHEVMGPEMEQQTGSKLRKERVTAGYVPCLFNFYAEDIMRNARLDEAQAGIKIDGRSINNLRYADDTTLMAESEEEPLDESERGV